MYCVPCATAARHKIVRFTEVTLTIIKVWLHIIKAEKINLTSKYSLLIDVIQQRQNSHLSLDMQVSHTTKIHTSQQGVQCLGFYIDCREVD